MKAAVKKSLRKVAYKNLPGRWWEDNPVVPMIEHLGDSDYPREFFDNLAFRINLLEQATADDEFANDLWIKCSRDILFFVNTFCYTFDPRLMDSCPEQPFITYPFQDIALIELRDAVMEGEDILIEKSRDMGATWMCLVVALWYWMFVDYSTSMIVSRKEALVDKPDDPDSLMWKLDFMYDRLPSWLSPKRKRTSLHLGNEDNGCTIDGDSSTGEVGRGGRRTFMLLDEHAKMKDGAGVSKATADVTNCRMFISTPAGTGNDFYNKRMMRGMRVLTLHWSLHPEKAKGCYIGDDKNLHSEWYDKECERRSIIDINQELNIGYRASDAQFFNQAKINELRGQSRKPNQTGELIFNKDTFEDASFMPRYDGGRFRLYIPLDMRGMPPRDRSYVLGVDISTGSGASDSVISVFDEKTGEKVAMWKDNHTDQPTLAKKAVAIGKWFCNSHGEEAYMIWEANGPGFLFGKKVIEHGYTNIYYDKNDKEATPKDSKRPGFYSTPDKKLLLLGDYRNALETGFFLNPSDESLEECEFYVYQNGTVVHARSQSDTDPTNQKNNHGDDVIADALAWRGYTDRLDGKPATVEEKKIPKVAEIGSFEHRRKAHLSTKKKSVGSWL